MRQTWRWFGPADEISIAEIRQTGTQGIVSALHHVTTGEVWSKDAIRQRQREISATHDAAPQLTWDVVESLPVSEDIKTQTGAFRQHLANYRESLHHLAACGIRTVCYNFMPVLDWTRTALSDAMPHGGRAMSFDLLDFAVFDIHILQRPGADEDYPADLTEAASERFARMSTAQRSRLQNNIVAGLPGSSEHWTLDDIHRLLATYREIDAERLRRHLIDFLSEVTPLAEELGINLCCHPDDPPFPLLGLPRIMSSEDDYARVMAAVDNAHNGITFCTGSLGVAEDFDPAGFVERLGPRIHFVHLRNTRRRAPSMPRKHSFYESEHLDGDTDLVAAIRALMMEEQRRRAEGREDWQIPMRPDHGQSLLSDLDRPMMPGYPLIGRLRGLAELRGVMAAFESM